MTIMTEKMTTAAAQAMTISRCELLCATVQKKSRKNIKREYPINVSIKL